MTRRGRPSPRSGTPRLPIGLNLGAQLFWQARAFPQEFAGSRRIVMYPQYWAYRLTGVLANEVTSLGCHTDLWNTAPKGSISSLVAHGMAGGRMAPVRKAGDRLGPVLPEIAAATGLRADHAGLLRHPRFQCLAAAASACSARQPFSVVSTGTWVIVMAVGGCAGRARSGARHAGQRQRARRSGAVGPLHGRARVRDAGRPRCRGAVMPTSRRALEAASC